MTSLLSAVEFRACKPEEGVRAAPLIYSAGPEAFRYAFSLKHETQALEFLHRVFQQPGHEFSFAAHQGLYLDGQLIAIGSLRVARDNFRFTMAALKLIIQFYGLNAPTGILRGLQTESVIRPPEKSRPTICNLAVLPEYQGQGLGTQIIKLLIEQAKMQGFTRLELDVAETNSGARELYQRLGFVSTQRHYRERLKSRFGRVVAHERMQLLLEP